VRSLIPIVDGAINLNPIAFLWQSAINLNSIAFLWQSKIAIVAEASVGAIAILQPHLATPNSVTPRSLNAGYRRL